MGIMKTPLPALFLEGGVLTTPLIGDNEGVLPRTLLSPQAPAVVNMKTPLPALYLGRGPNHASRSWQRREGEGVGADPVKSRNPWLA